MLKNIVLDFGNVIMNWSPDQILNHYELTPKEHDILKDNIFGSKEWPQIDAGRLTEQEAEKIFLQRVPENLQEKTKQIMATWPENVDFYEPMFLTIEAWRKQGLKIYGLSNTGMQFANFVKNSGFGDYFDGYVFSAEEKLLKPDERIYQKLIDRYELDPKECVFVDDLKENTQAAEKLGMYGFTFKIDQLGQLRQFVVEHS
ncbi:HAD superfamily hydrolase [Lactobacillus pasteurii DSM 23907 = CRBIP 24.76]|uniref:Predicted hydrolase (HAD superfamily) n=1 Tax=Lactobacillus pasteurii DSM 23907 = CRBIP 24.76 TaxID=1423790 RepID=I7LAC4_9LACO|nr:HAD family phosphatase [Lactobacillus pasteurii]KRK07380.1 HAD superfamily hydrolase [Lactobacillus pasteurii DSM 23907 = CRBIP 24.76]TDG77792.1 hypothetical protein C5L33_000016 [Lactobacillus pasteurii]CCI84566.1 Predicted hydrolase (HAD superfamily) [Lactobacillus pasteurii DSM 23907 = CRBIP 24.76]